MEVCAPSGYAWGVCMTAIRYNVCVGTKTFAVDAEPGKEVRIAGSDTGAEIRRVDATTLSVLLDGRSYTFRVARSEDGYVVGDGVAETRVTVDSERSRLLKRVSAVVSRADHGTSITAPMPALVVRLEVAPGQSVVAGQGLLVLEAMKMENEIRSPRAGIVKKIQATVGRAVEKGEVLITLE